MYSAMLIAEPKTAPALAAFTERRCLRADLALITPFNAVECSEVAMAR